MTGDDFRRFASARPEDVREIVHRHSPRLLAIARAYLDEEDARDIVQVTWITAIRQVGQLRAPGAFAAWLAQICRNRCLNEIRRRSRQARGHRAWGEENNGSAPAPDAELQRALLAAMADLPERQRQVAHLRLVEGRSTQETARLLGCTEGTVKSALHAAIRKLRTSLQDWNP